MSNPFETQDSFETHDSGEIRSSQSSRSAERMSPTSQEKVIKLVQLFKRMAYRPPETKKSVDLSSEESMSSLMERTFKRLTDRYAGGKNKRDLKATLDPDSDVYKFLFESNIPPLPTKNVDTVLYMEEQERLRALYFAENPAIFCDRCSEEHDRYYGCHNIPCSVCYKDGHIHHFCPYKLNIPEWADFDRKRYHVVCGSCNSSVDMSTWLCTYCYTSMPKLDKKYCEICQAIEDHITVDCPNDTDQADFHKRQLDILIKNNRTRSVSPFFAEYLAKRLASKSDA